MLSYQLYIYTIYHGQCYSLASEEVQLTATHTQGGACGLQGGAVHR